MPTARTADGVDVAWYDLGGTGPDLLLAHATGFCGAVWEPAATRLTERFHVVTFDERGHGRSAGAPEGNYEWHGFSADALAVIEAASLDRPLAGGHSCGAALLLLAEQEIPGTFAALWCFEPIAFPAAAPPGAKNHLAIGARRRRAEFASRHEARANYAAKPPLNELDDDVLDAYIRCGFVDTEAGSVRLACDPESEARTYEMGSRHDAFARLPEVNCPVTMLCGGASDAIGPSLLALQAERLRNARTEIWDGQSHFAPLAHPARAAASITAAFAG